MSLQNADDTTVKAATSVLPPCERPKQRAPSFFRDTPPLEKARESLYNAPPSKSSPILLLHVADPTARNFEITL